MTVTARALLGALLAVLMAVALAGCAPGARENPPSPTGSDGSTAPASSPSTTPTPTPTPTPTADPLAGLTLEQRVGQLFMVGMPVGVADSVGGIPSPTRDAIERRHVGGVFLQGRSHAGVAAIARVTSQLDALAAGETPAETPPLWVATDQEGGEVQVLRGDGFDDMPYAIRQADRTPGELRTVAARWGRELADAGVTLNLAPVADIVTSHDTRFDNPPIGGLGRQYGYDEATVAAKAGAFADGMRDSGVMPTLKHFPGLGRVTANTDYADRVVDTVVTADSPDVDVYRTLLADGPAVVMVGLAVYAKIDDSAPAAFSTTVVDDVLRDRVGFDGVVMTDDLSAARAVRAVPPAERALRAMDVGCDLLLISADPSVLPEMYDAVLARAQTDAGFARRVDESAARIITAKAAAPN